MQQPHRSSLRPSLTMVLCTLTFASIGPLSAQEPQPGLVPELCFAAGTPQRVVEEYAAKRLWQDLTSLQHADSTRYQFNDGDRWSRTATDGCCSSQGEPITLTWSIVPDGTSIHGYNGEGTSPSNLRAFLNATVGSPSTWLPLFAQVFNRWGELTGIQYVYEPNDDGSAWTSGGIQSGQLGVRGDVRIAGHALDGNGGVLAYNFFPNYGDMVIDTSDNLFGNSSNNFRLLRNTLSHEHGHGIGLSHVCPLDDNKLMEPFLNTNFDGPQHDDILAANRGYGDDAEENETADQAETTSGSQVVREHLSIDDGNDVDVFSFTMSVGNTIDMTVTPIGQTYDNGPQTGSCSSGSTVNTLNDQNLQIEILAPNGTTVLAQSDTANAGSVEMLQNVLAAQGAGTYFAVVRGDRAGNPQMYRLELERNDSLDPMIFESTFELSDLSDWTLRVPI